MSNQRLDLQEIAAKIAEGLGVNVADENAAVYVSTAYDPKYWSLFFSKWPAVWIVAQKIVPRDDGQGYTGLIRQTVDVQLMVRPVVQRVTEVAGDSADVRISELSASVDNALFGWTPTGAGFPFTWASSVDGASNDSLCSIDMIYSTLVQYSKPSPA